MIRNRDSGNPGLFCDEAVDEVKCINALLRIWLLEGTGTWLAVLFWAWWWSKVDSAPVVRRHLIPCKYPKGFLGLFAD